LMYPLPPQLLASRASAILLQQETSQGTYATREPCVGGRDRGALEVHLLSTYVAARPGSIDRVQQRRHAIARSSSYTCYEVHRETPGTGVVMRRRPQDADGDLLAGTLDMLVLRTL